MAPDGLIILNNSQALLQGRPDVILPSGEIDS